MTPKFKPENWYLAIWAILMAFGFLSLLGKAGPFPDRFVRAFEVDCNNSTFGC